MYHMQRQRKLPEDHARFYGAEICLALNFLHDKGRSIASHGFPSVCCCYFDQCVAADFVRNNSRIIKACLLTKLMTN